MRSLLSITDGHMPRHKLAGLTSALAGTAIASSAVLAPAQAIAHTQPLLCRTAVTNRYPSEYGTTIVVVKTVAKARVTTSAYYKTTTNTKSTKANVHGIAAVAYDVSDATEGYKVIVIVRVHSGNRSGSCRTSYTPE